MKKMKWTLLLLLILTLSACKPEVVFDDGFDSNTMEVTITDGEEYHIRGEIIYHSLFDFEDLYLMMFANTHYEGNDRVTINDLSINDESVSYEFQGVDRSAIHMDLNNPILEGDVITIEYDMDVMYPDTFRNAHYGDMIYQMYFYPFVAMYDGEFDLDPYALRGETYYNNFNNYDVTITLDEDFIVAAPGELMSSKTKDRMTSHRYILEEARDFSFSASTYYTVYDWEAVEIDYEIYSIRELGTQELEDTKEYVRKSIDVYSSYIGDYPYDRFVLELGHIYGMESTGLIFCSEEISEGTIVHEVIHQWFFFMIGNDSYTESFLDESLTTYLTSFYFYDLYGMDGYNGYLDERSSSLERLSEHWNTYLGDSLLETPDEMGDGYAFIIYYHGPSLFREYVDTYLGNDIEEFSRILSVYYDEYYGEVATIDEFLTLLEEESGVDTTKEWFYFHLNELQDVTNTP